MRVILTPMAAVLFDTLRLSRTLQDKGHFTTDQADALAEALAEAVQGDLATKADLAALQSGIKAEIAELKTELKGDISHLRTELKGDVTNLRTELKGDISQIKTSLAETKADILKWIIGAIGFQTVVLIGTLMSLAHIFAK